VERRAPEILAVELEQVKGEQEHPRVLAPVPEPVEYRHAVAIAGHGLAVDQERAHLERAGGLENLWIPWRPIVPVAGEQPDAADGAPDHHAEAVVLDLVNPAGAEWRAIGGGGADGADETRRGPGGAAQQWERQ